MTGPDEPARVRRAPRFSRFVTAGALAGTVLGSGAAVLADGTTYTLALVVILGVAVGGLGALFGGLVAVLVDRRTVRN